MRIVTRLFPALLLVCALSACDTTGVNTTRSTMPVPVVAPVEAAHPTNAGSKPVVMLLIDEQNLGAISVSDVETLGSRALQKAGCRTVDQDMLRANIEQRKRLLKSVGDNRGAAAVGQQFGAEVIIIGDAVCQPGTKRIGDSNLRSYQAVVSLRAVRTDNATVLASVSKDGTALDVEDLRGGSKSLKLAGKNNFTVLIPEMIAAWQGGALYETATSEFPHRIELTFGGVDQLWKVKAIREKLKASKETDAVKQRSYTAGAAIFELDCSLPAEEFAENLVLDAPENITLQALAVESGKLVFRVVTR